MVFNSGIACSLIVLIWRLIGWEDKCLDCRESTLITSLWGGIIGHYACSTGDTWSSEIGVLSDAQPRLITTFKVKKMPSYVIIYILALGILTLLILFIIVVYIIYSEN